MIRLQARSPSLAAHAPGALPEALAIEIDGVEISGGVLTEHVGAATIALLDGVATLVAGRARAVTLPFADGNVALVLARRDAHATISIVRLSRPARLLVRDLEVELAPLAAAARVLADELAGSLQADEQDRLQQARELLARALARPGAARPTAEPAKLHGRAAPAAPGAPTFGFALRDDDGRVLGYEGDGDLHALLVPGQVQLHGPAGEELVSLSGTPFLLLRDLVGGATRLLSAVRRGEATAELPLGEGLGVVELALPDGPGRVAGRELRCGAVSLARAACEGAIDWTVALAARNERFATHPQLTALVEEAREARALALELSHEHVTTDSIAPPPATPASPSDGGAPLAPGELRRIVLRVAWRAGLGTVRGLALRGARALVAEEDGLASLRLSDGRVTRRLALEGAPQLFAPGPKALPIAATGDGRLLGVRPDLRVRWLRAPGPARELGPDGGLVLTDDGRELAVTIADGRILLGTLLATGRIAYRLVPPGAVRARLALAGGLAVLGSDTGLVYGLDARSGTLAWRLRVTGAVRHVAFAGSLVVGAAEGGREGTLLFAADATSGAPRWRHELGPTTKIGGLLARGSKLLVSLTGETGGEVRELDEDGAVTRTHRPVLGELPPSLVAIRGAIFARGDRGLARFSRGRVAWSTPCRPGGAPVLVRSVLALPGDRLQLVDAASGRDLSDALPAELPAADHLIVHGRRLVVLDHTGHAAALDFAGGLGLVDGAKGRRR